MKNNLCVCVSHIGKANNKKNNPYMLMLMLILVLSELLILFTFKFSNFFVTF